MKPINDKSQNDGPNNDEKLLLVYFKEANQQAIDEGLKDTEFCQQLDQLESDMNTIEQAYRENQPQLPEDYGQQLWHQIADKLTVEQVSKFQEKSPSISWAQKFKNWVLVPQYSLASFVVVAGLVMVAFFVGKQQNTAVLGIGLQEQLLAQNIQLHLTQSEIFLTQVNNDNGSYNSRATAQRLLSSNRIFKQALSQHDGQFTHQLLQDLEPILLEYANDSQNHDSTDVDPYQSHGTQPQANWVKNSQPKELMFQIKAMKQQLAQKNDII